MTATPPSTARRAGLLCRKALRCLRWFAGLAVLWFTVHLTVIAWIGTTDDLQPSDVAVVLGNKVEDDGSPGTTLQARLDRTLEVYQAGLFEHIIVSGATNPMGYDEPAAMRRYLVARGVPAEVIIEDGAGTNTFCTARNTRRIMREHEWKTAMVISHYSHVPRIRLAFWRMGITDVRSAHAWFYWEWREPHTVLREFAAFYYYLARSYPPAK